MNSMRVAEMWLYCWRRGGAMRFAIHGPASSSHAGSVALSSHKGKVHLSHKQTFLGRPLPLLKVSNFS